MFLSPLGDGVGDGVHRPIGGLRIDPQLKEERGQSGEREPGRRLRGPYRNGCHTPVGPERAGRTSQTGLADAGSTEEPHPMAILVVECLTQSLELDVPTEERPHMCQGSLTPLRHGHHCGVWPPEGSTGALAPHARPN
jgi:hypothetical protein